MCIVTNSHILVAGGGRVGFRVAQFFRQRGHQVTIIERDPDRANEQDSDDIEVVVGDATKPSVLSNALTDDTTVIGALTDSDSSELPCPTALGATRPSLVEGRASCFCVGIYTQRGHRDSRLRRRFPFRGGSECPTPTESTLGHNRRCTLFVAFEQRQKRGEHLTTSFDRRGSKRGGERASNSCGRCIPPCSRLRRSLRKGA
ncbi:potassium channel family protein [Natronoarchaeum sp. GCM10025703]|uniref:potassium channel family protein n=1 Tax=Natronoarchaeum sp. GCM10025703 TaxID=3252685 RepID=UPI0036196C26